MNLDGLKDYQCVSAEKLRRALETFGVAADGSDTGTGKTYKACALVRHYNLPTLVVCPKVVISAWNYVAGQMSTEVSALNYEKLRTGNTPFGEHVDGELHENSFVWNPAIKFLIFDEVHRCKGRRTLNAQLLWAARRQRIPTMVLSATMAESPLDMRALGYLLGLHTGSDFSQLGGYSFSRWARNYGCNFSGYGAEFIGWPGEDGKQRAMAALHKMIFEERGDRVRIADLPSFPETQITAEIVDTAKDADKIYKEMADALAELAEKRKQDRFSDYPLTRLLRARQEAELLLVPGLVDRAKDAIQAGNSVALFCCFSETIDQLAERLETDCILDGRPQHIKQRDCNINRFQTDDSRIVIVNEGIAEGIGLHDITGQFPRLSLICPGYSARRLRQIFGRVQREGAKSKSVQQVIFPASSIGKSLRNRLTMKLDCIDALNDGDLEPENLENFCQVSSTHFDS